MCSLSTVASSYIVYHVENFLKINIGPEELIN